MRQIVILRYIGTNFMQLHESDKELYMLYSSAFRDENPNLQIRV